MTNCVTRAPIFPLAISLVLLAARSNEVRADSEPESSILHSAHQFTGGARVTSGVIQVGEVDVCYCAGGHADAPALLVLHSCSSSSHMFRNLISLLATKYRVVALDILRFGSAKAPPRAEFARVMTSLIDSIDGFADAMELVRFDMYMFDYGAPVGFRLATAHPEHITTIITQDSNIYEEGLADTWTPVERYQVAPV